MRTPRGRAGLKPFRCCHVLDLLQQSVSAAAVYQQLKALMGCGVVCVTDGSICAVQGDGD